MNKLLTCFVTAAAIVGWFVAFGCSSTEPTPIVPCGFMSDRNVGIMADSTRIVEQNPTYEQEWIDLWTDRLMRWYGGSPEEVLYCLDYLLASRFARPFP